jgi:hypothetical protein
MSDYELDLLVRYIGEPQARELARLGRLTSGIGIPQQAFDELAKAVKGFTGMYGAQSDARRALAELMKRYPD